MPSFTVTETTFCPSDANGNNSVKNIAAIVATTGRCSQYLKTPIRIVVIYNGNYYFQKEVALLKTETVKSKMKKVTFC